MKFIYDSTTCVLHLLLLAELFVHTSSRPTSSPSLCGMFGSMTHQVDRLKNFSKKLHGLTDSELKNFAVDETRLDSLPHIRGHAGTISPLKVNESLSQLYEYTQSFRIHVDWLKTAQENVSLPSTAAQSASTHLQHLSNLVTASLNQIGEEVPQSPTPSLPVVSTAFDALQFSVEISERLQVFCDWSKRVLLSLKRTCRKP